MLLMDIVTYVLTNTALPWGAGSEYQQIPAADRHYKYTLNRTEFPIMNICNYAHLQSGLSVIWKNEPHRF
jgi:hypothetical protein